MDELTARIGSTELYLDATLLVALLTVVWVFARRLAEVAYFRLSLRTCEFEIELQPKRDVPESITSLNLLFVRYGNDTYLEKLASDIDRYHGRLQNRVVRIADRSFPKDKPLPVRLKVHKRLGSQFKFFVDVTGDPKAAHDYLVSHDTLIVDKLETLNPRPRLRRSDPVQYRIFFLLRRLDTAETVEGFTNNFIYPV